MFTFKQFAVKQDRTAMKVGTDGVLLGAWTTPPVGTSSILDIGTGTGLIALMLAQRFEGCNIDAVEIDMQSSLQAEENFKATNWSDRVEMYNQSIEQFVDSIGEKRYECVVSNPPYFSNSLKCPDGKRTVARHNSSLSLETLLDCSCRALKIDGVLSVVLPVQEGSRLIDLSKDFGFKAERVCRIFPTVNSIEPKRLLIELRLSTEDIACICSDLTIENGERFNYTQDYIDLTKDFYLKF